ncbi:MAG: alginate lyase family protein [Mangrovibacterium sp.]
MKSKTCLSSALMLFVFISCNVTSAISQSVSTKGIFVDFDETGKVKKQIQQKDKRFLPAYAELINKAETALNEGPFSVTDKKKVPPSGDKHDYLSLGPYWWPDPSKPDGLPYIRKDGERNPETTGENVDSSRKSKMFNNVEILSWAFYFSGEVKYAQKVVELLEAWFIDPRTKMNPNLNYAQGIPGISEGRGIGIIDWAGINKLISPIQILEASGFLPPDKKEALSGWFDDYLTWLCTSDYGKDEDDYFNNHGTHFDVQAVGIALFLGKIDMAKKRLENAKSKRIVAQIEPDGSQPHELARTKSLSYSTMNLRGFILLADMAQRVGVDLWNFETTDGRGIKKALDFLLPFVCGEKKWEHQQISDMEEAMESLKLNYHIAAVKTGDKRYSEVARSLRPATKLDILLYPLFE